MPRPALVVAELGRLNRSAPFLLALAPDRARKRQVLADADVRRRIVLAAMDQDADFGALVLVLAATGARLDQAARLAVADLQPEAGRIMVPASRKGRGPSRSRSPRCPCRRTW